MELKLRVKGEEQEAGGDSAQLSHKLVNRPSKKNGGAAAQQRAD